MAISTKNLNVQLKKPESAQCPCPPCPPCPPIDPERLILYDTYEEAVEAVNKIHLLPGDSHVEFFKDDSKIHCVVGIGNINQGKFHLILTDDGEVGPIYKQIENINEQIEKLKKDVSTAIIEELEVVKSTVAELQNNVQIISSDLKSLQKEVDENYETLNSSLSALRNTVDSINNTVNSHTSSIQQLNNRVNNNENKIIGLEQTIQNVSSNVSNINKQIVNINTNISNIQKSLPTTISNSSIDSLFTDIYTVNLCCYTKAGYVKVPEYNTYESTDSIEMGAYANLGYDFVGWYKDGKKYTTNTSINVNFLNGDINVIGTAINLPQDRPILQNGYSAVFSKLIEINTYKHVNPPLHEIDSDIIKLTNVVDGKYAYENTNVIVEAIPAIHHKFDHFVISTDGSTNVNPYTIKNIKTDTEIHAYFEEIRYVVIVGENNTAYGRGVGGGIKLEGTKEIISAIPASGYVFRKWQKRNLNTQKTEYIVGSHIIEVTYDADYEYIAIFEEQSK